MVVNTKGPNKKPAKDKGDKELSLPLVIVSGVLVLAFVLFMYNAYVGPIFPHGPRKSVHVAPPPGFPDVPPYNTKEWQENAQPGQRMPGVPPIDYSRQSGPSQPPTN